MIMIQYSPIALLQTMRAVFAFLSCHSSKQFFNNLGMATSNKKQVLQKFTHNWSHGITMNVKKSSSEGTHIPIYYVRAYVSL